MITQFQNPQQVEELEPVELALLLEAGEPLQVLDVRAPERLAMGRIDLGPPESFFNVPNSRLFSLRDAAESGLSRERPVVAVCGHGHSSQQATAWLSRQGFQARSMSGGMAAWMRTLLPRELPAPQGFSRLLQFDRIGKGALGYLLLSGDSAVAIDPPRDFAPYEEAAQQSGARIVAVADTHVHADYVSGAQALAAKHGLPYYLHPADNVYPFDGTPGRLNISPLSDGQTIGLRQGELKVMYTPGHTEGSVCLIAGDQACFSGDFIFIESLGRPDLAGRSAEWTPQLHASLLRALAEWPDGLTVYPGHYAGQSERNADRSIGRSFGELKQSNSALAPKSAEDFAQWVRSGLSTPPEAYPIIKAINAGLMEATEPELEILEAGRNECALR